jgi:hypothetical protein
MGRMRLLRTWSFSLLAMLLALLAACANGPREVDVPAQRLEAALARRFPYELRPAGLFTLTVGVPHLQLLPQEDRLRLDFPVDATGRILQGGGHGALSVSFGLRYEPTDTSLRAVNVRVERVALQGLPEAWSAPLQLAGSTVAERLLEGTALHTFTAEDLARARGWTPGSIRVTPQGVRIELLPPVAAAGLPR